MAIEQEATWGPKVASDQRLWRYMNYPKFLHLLHSKSLYFARLSRMPDLFEGHLPRISVEAGGEEIDSTPGNAVPGAMMPGATPEWGRHHLGEEATKRARETYINCWHMNDIESSAMWVLYGGRGASVAITTTYGRLREAVAGADQLWAGSVKYQRFDSEHIMPTNFYAPLFHKRQSFAHEHEMRLALHDSTNTEPDHKLVDVDLRKLLESVRLAPTTAPGVRDAVQDILRRYDLPDMRVGHSILDKAPYYD